MAARPPRPARIAFFLALLVAALALAPIVDGLSAHASARASGKVDPEADPSSLLPTWPTGTNDPCIAVFGTIGDLGNHLGFDCKSYVCINRVLINGGTTCIVRVNPGTTELQVKVLWTPSSLVGWTVTAKAREFANAGTPLECPNWIGPANVVPPSPLGLAPCNLVPYWDGASRAEVGFDAAGGTAAGSIGVYIGPPDPL